MTILSAVDVGLLSEQDAAITDISKRMGKLRMIYLSEYLT
jgi:hypothetical protein